MKYILVLLLLNSLACMRSPIKLNYYHPNTGSAEYLINHTKERFIQAPTQSRKWIQEGLLVKAFDFRSTVSTTLVHILFFDSQTEAIEFEKANNLHNSATLKSVLNGAVLYVIQSDDKHKADELVGWFAGKE
jgi:hypothetical protein